MNKRIKVSMIVIGDEILSGRTTDANASWLSKYLFKKGLHLESIRFIKDDLEIMSSTLTLALEESDIVITSGGIGPTLDDKTKKAWAQYFNSPIIEREDVKILVKQNYHRFNREWNPTHNFYHFFPQNFIATNNPKGLAPGIVYFDHQKNKLLMSAPGVPHEFKAMVDQEFFPLIEEKFSQKIQQNYQTIIRTVGIPEEKIFNELCPNLWSDLEKIGKVSSLPHTIGIDIIISYSELKNQDEEIKSIINNSALHKYVWHWGAESLPELILKRALEKNITFSFAESCTGGLASSKMTDLAGVSECFMGGVVSYSNRSKEIFLSVQAKTLKNFGAVSVETAIEMALGAREKFHSDIAISITGIAGPDGGTEEKPVGTVVIGFATKTKSGATTYNMPGDRLRKKERFSDRALLTLLELINLAH